MKRGPRVVRVWAVLACLVFAVVVSVGSVPVLAWRGQVSSQRQWLRVLELYELDRGQAGVVAIGRMRVIGFTRWFHTLPDGMHPRTPAATNIAADPRPAWAATPDGSWPEGFQAYSVGLPFHSARGWFFLPSTWKPVVGSVQISLPPSRMLQYEHRGRTFDVPIVPRWPGLIANTLIFFALPFLPWTLLRWRRLRRIGRLGLCYRCRYEFPRQIATCPECGTTRPPN